MKNIYILLVAIMLMITIAGPVQAQIYTTVPAGGNVSNPATWVGGIQPPLYCSACLIFINGNVTIDIPGIGLDNGSVVTINANANLNINDPLILKNNSEILVGNDAINPAALILNSEIDLYTNSFVRLANNNPGTLINALSGATTPFDSLSNITGDLSGIYYIITGGGTAYDVLICTFGYGDPAALTFEYTINCVASAGTPICAQGVVYGPAISDSNSSTGGLWQFSNYKVLPVVLLQFTASMNSDQSVAVAWATSQEVNSSYYALARSSDGIHFSVLEDVKAKGFSSVTTDYAWTDEHPLSGINYYRLQMFDLDGKYQYSPIIKISADEKAVPVVVYNNPFTDQIRLKLHSSSAGSILLTLTDVLGRTVLHELYHAQRGDNFVNLYSGSFRAGLYLLSLKGNSFDQTIKLVRQ